MPSITEAVKNYLGINWSDTVTDSNIEGYIARGKSRLNAIAGVTLNYDVEGFPRQLLLDYCRYANSQALEMFEINFQSELLSLNIQGCLGEYDENTEGSE